MVHQLPLEFNLDLLRSYFEQVKVHEVGGQISLKYRKQFQPYQDGHGSALDPHNPKKILFTEDQFTELVEGDQNPIFDVISQVSEFAKKEYHVGIGRIRFMIQKPKTCLSYHRDFEQHRFHIPIYTNTSCFFIVEEQVYKMPQVGRLHTLRVDKMHTSINANKELPRTHLVFTTFPLKQT